MSLHTECKHVTSGPWKYGKYFLGWSRLLDRVNRILPTYMGASSQPSEQELCQSEPSKILVKHICAFRKRASSSRLYWCYPGRERWQAVAAHSVILRVIRPYSEIFWIKTVIPTPSSIWETGGSLHFIFLHLPNSIFLAPVFWLILYWDSFWFTWVGFRQFLCFRYFQLLKRRFIVVILI